MRSDRSHPTTWLVAAILLAAALVGGCADFGDADRSESAGPFSANTQAPPMSTPQPTPTQPQQPEGPPPTGPCVDPDPAVIATCLDATTGVLPGDADGTSTVVAERTTGKIIQASRNGPKKVLATIPVDSSGDGGLLDFRPSPSYAQDQLIYALISTPSDNRVVRIAPGDVPKPILTGIPKGASGNGGSLLFVKPNELWVATGNAGNPAAASDPSSLAGKVLSTTSLNSDASTPPRVLSSGIGADASLCRNATTGSIYLTDQLSDEDRLQLLSSAGIGKTLWTWPDKPMVAGCAATNGAVLVSTARTQHVEALPEPTRDRPTVTAPTVVLDKRYGALGRMAAVGNGVVQVGTVNKQYGSPGQTDDRVIRLPVPSGSENRI
ncbi:PQQ-dependent sugar dehydrogenase [Williamsia sterculiae]|uniref:Glucose/arabinose dehydrogenase, beta-propeller fold n=1 Tax=Williamsia sterculiae TaxID=1344003 RepID=A0A1N7G4I0_9NOCA|nr:PQQ-dependent sugar dehydrogenase [Williamsia sterculiae]SIS07356.1 Glucose/arabinose dehydrogenase, beta-propeller fold [Williamsia sterculiae]